MDGGLKLGVRENGIRELLVEFAGVYASVLGQPVTPRFVGGWVRDKLLGRAPNDIDIAVDMGAAQFATALQTWLITKGHKPHSVHKIARNPQKSKNLETATTRIYGISLDFTSLQGTLEIGTPQEDAVRRDATVNALFYNLELGRVEDFTGQGMADLEAGMLRTPVDPAVTFGDDPVRIIRLLRFVAQFSFDLDPATAAAMTTAQAGLARVSKERVGCELEKLLKGPDVAKALLYIPQLKLRLWGNTPEPAHCLEERILKTELVYAQVADFHHEEDAVVAVWLATLLEPFEKEEMSVRGKPQPAPLVLIKEGMRMATHHARLVVQLLRRSHEARELLESHDRKALGYFVRECKEKWPVCLAYAACRFNEPAGFRELYKRIVVLGLAKAYEIKHILSRSDILAMYPGRNPGSWLNAPVRLQIALQLENPGLCEEKVVDLVLESLDPPPSTGPGTCQAPGPTCHAWDPHDY